MAVRSAKETYDEPWQETLIEGVRFPTFVTQKSIDAVRAFEIRDDDVWVSSHPKAGTHLMFEIVCLIFAEGHLEQVDREKQPVLPEFEYDAPGVSGLPPGSPRQPRYEYMSKWKSPRVIGTHLSEQFMPRQIYEGKGKVIKVIRNPKDSAVSYWHFLKPQKANPAYLEWDTYIKHYCSEDARYESWFTHNLNFWKKHAHRKNFLFVYYEDLMKDMKEVIKQVAEFIGHPLNAEATERIVKHCTLENMRKRYYDTSESIATLGVRKMGRPHLIRKGQVGDWKNKFTVAQNEEFDKLYKEKMEGLDLNITFEL